MLSEPSKDTKRKILLSVNFTFIGALLVHLAIQFINFGKLPDPARDMVLFPILILVNGYSAYHNLRVLKNLKTTSLRIDGITTWSTLITTMLVALLFVHTNKNTAVSMLLDHGFSVVLLFIVGTIAGRRAAIVWFLISGTSLFFAYYNLGANFEYHLLAPEEFEAYKLQLDAKDSAALAQQNLRDTHQLTPFPASLYASIWFIFSIVAFLATFFESNLISRVLDAIPNVISKINIAANERTALQKDNMRMGLELDVARKIQMMLLPKEGELSMVPYLSIGAVMDPASEVGGDFYEVLPQTDGSVVLAIGDVTDHGLQSGLVMLMAQSTVRTVLDNKNGISLSSAMIRINEILFKNIRMRMEDTRNLTLSLLRINENEVTICGQHENVLIYRAATQTVEIVSTDDLGLFVGLIDDITEHVAERVVPFASGDTILLITDGLTEAQNREDHFFGEDRIIEVFQQHIRETPEHIVKNIREAVLRFMGSNELLDDISMMVIRRK